MGLARSTYYATGEKPSDAAITAEIRAITDEFECYGYRRVDAELRRRGQVVNAKKVRRLMRAEHLGGVQPSVNPYDRLSFFRKRAGLIVG